MSPEMKALLREKAQKVAAEMPPLTTSQLTQLRILLGGRR